MQILPIQSEIRHIFHYHVNIILKHMVEFVSESVEIVTNEKQIFTNETLYPRKVSKPRNREIKYQQD